VTAAAPPPDELVLAATQQALEGHHEAVRAAVRRLAVPHWYDERLVSVLIAPRGSDPADWQPADVIMIVLETLPFIEVHALRGVTGRFRLHAGVRRALLDDLVRTDPEFVRSVSTAVAEELAGRADPDDDEIVEHLFHQLIVNEDEGMAAVAELFATPRGPAGIAVFEHALQCMEELRSVGMISVSTEMWSLCWSILVKVMAGDYRTAVSLGDAAIESLAGRPEVADAVRIEQVIAYTQLGEVDEVHRLAGPLIERHAGTELAPYIRLLLSDVAGNPEDSRRELITALTQLMMVVTGEPVDVSALRPQDWTIGQDGVVGFSGRNHNVPMVPLFPEIWIRLGQLAGQQGQVADAFVWFGHARTAYALAGNDIGIDRVATEEHYLAVDYGDITRLRELLPNLVHLIEWARSEEAPRVEMSTIFQLANVYQALQEVNSAMDAFTGVLRLAGQLDDAWHGGRASEGLARIAVDNGDFAAADDLIERAAGFYGDDFPEDRRMLDLLVGERWLKAGDSAKAIASAQRVLDAAPQPEDEIWARLLYKRAEQTRLNLAGMAEQFAAIDPLLPQVDLMLRLRAMTEQLQFLRLSNQDDQAMVLEREIEAIADEQGLTSELGWLVFDRASTAGRRCDHEAAVRGLRKAVDLFGSCTDEGGLYSAFNQLAWELAEVGQYDEAWAALGEAERLATPDRPAFWSNNLHETRGILLTETGRLTEGIAELLVARELNPAEPSICTNLGWAFLRADRFEESLEWSYRALELDPHEMFPHNNIGHALLAMGRPEEAMRSYRIVIDSQFGDDNFRDTLEELDDLLRRHPGLPGLPEAIAMFSAEQDRLEPRRAAQNDVDALAMMITNPATAGPLHAAVVGRWGSGKTSFMRQVQERVEQLAPGSTMNIRQFRFNAWLQADEQPWVWLVSALSRALDIPEVRDVRARRLADLMDRLEAGDRVVIYVDDLDRCPPARVVEILNTMHTSLALPPFVVVVAIDPGWLHHSLRQAELAHQPDRLFHVVFTLRPNESTIGALPRTVQAPPHRLDPTPAELAFLRRLAPELGTPLAARKLVNLYQLVRTGMSAAELESFVAGPYQVVMVLLALLVTNPHEARSAFLRLTQSGHPADALPAELLTLTDDRFRQDVAPYRFWAGTVARFSFETHDLVT
jgi:tetratricopeptide (TPR) repeat protein